MTISDHSLAPLDFTLTEDDQRNAARARIFLPDDVSRCLGEIGNGSDTMICSHREQCKRYLNRFAGGPRTSFVLYLCGPEFESQIPLKED